MQEVQDPTSPFYHQFLTPQEVTARFGASQEDWDALVAFAKASGFEIVSGNREERDLRLTGTVANIEKAFHVTMGTYHDLTEDRTFFAVDREPTVDLPFQLWHITGLDNDSSRIRCMSRKATTRRLMGSILTKSCPMPPPAPALRLPFWAATCARPTTAERR